MKALIFAGGDFLPPDNFVYNKFSLVICADKGIENAKKAGVVPHLYVGDFDSCVPPGEGEVLRFSAEKDVTDTEIAVDEAIKRGADSILILGGTGGRADHGFANILLLARVAKKGIDIKMYDGTNLLFVLTESSEISKNNFKYLSVFPLFGDVENLSLSGVKYPLLNYLLPSASSLCVSNEIKGESAKISFSKGDLLVILSAG